MMSAAQPLARVQKSTFRVHIADALKGAILDGHIAPGTQVTEASLAEQFGVSRGPLREAMRQLIEEGLLVTVPYTGTRVVDLSVEGIREIYSMRVVLELFAFEQIWDRRHKAFRTELRARHARLTNAIDARDDRASIHAELLLHGLVYEAANHGILLKTWESIKGRLQLYWAAHHRAHGITGPRRDGHDAYIATALGNDLDALRAEISSHMARGREQTEAFVLQLTSNPGSNASSRQKASP